MKTLIFGNGFIASHLNYPIANERLFANDFYIRNILNKYKPDIVINCVAYCGSKNIDDCEINKEKTIESNLTIPTILAQECNKFDIRLLHFGSGCINYGKSPNTLLDGSDAGWKETDDPILKNASLYSKIKYAADLAIGSLSNVSILRLRMPISNKNHPRNLINKLLKYENVLETKNSVTFVDDLVRVVDWVIENNKTGIYNITNPKPMTHIQLLEEYRKYFPTHKYNIINEEQLKQFILAPRSNCIINSDKLKNEGFVMTPTEMALKHCIKQYVGNI